jgi:hypothetical protein
MPSLLFHGVYRGRSAVAGEDSRFTDHYLRFYPDGRAVGATTYRTYPTNVARWLAYESVSPFLSRGTCLIAGNRISFTATSSYGAVDYEGGIGSDGSVLELASYSRINRYRGRYTYTFTLIRFRK